jgi:hypothetical protein
MVLFGPVGFTNVDVSLIFSAIIYRYGAVVLLYADIVSIIKL